MGASVEPDEPGDHLKPDPTPVLLRSSTETLSIVLVEDSAEYALLVSELLREGLGESLDVRVRGSLDAAGPDLSSGVIDCVLLDLGLPDAHGLEALAGVRGMAPSVPVVVLSGQEDEQVALKAVDHGAQDYLVKRHADSHLLSRAIRHAIQRKETELALARQALHDPLTGLPNRTLFVDRLQVALSRAARGEHRVAVMFLDLDCFKAVNDNFGHDAGDRLLRDVSDRLAAMMRPSDTVARFGGDEFMVLCDGLADEREAVIVAERISAGLAEAFDLDGEPVLASASVGIAFAGTRTSTPEALIRQADRAMYRAKKAHRRYELAAVEPVSATPGPVPVELQLEQALENEELVLHYQPEFDLSANEIFSAEALLRWRHPERGLVAPDQFIPAAEHSGLIVPIGEWVLDEACRQLVEWRRHDICAPGMSMSVNLSRRQLADPDLAEKVETVLARSGVAPQDVCFEVTESGVADEPEVALRRLAELKELGVELSLDDFGTGLSSLAVLDAYPLDMLKIDRSFVASLGQGMRPQRLFAAIVGVAHALGLRAVAEGIETQDQLDTVARIGCDAVQGFHLCRPGAADVIAPAFSQVGLTTI